jgi:hypothetical protein
MVIQVVMKKTIGASDFKATRVLPLVERPDRLVGAMKGKIKIRGDIVGPLGVPWKATKR